MLQTLKNIDDTLQELKKKSMNLKAGMGEKRGWGRNEVKEGGWVWHSFAMTRFNPILPVEPLRDFSRGARWLDLTTWLYYGKLVEGKSHL